MKGHSTVADIQADARSQLRSLGARAKKGLGQHFLVDRGVLRKILSAAELAPHDTVIEVGPGLGILTQELVRKAGRVIAIEIDPNLAASLQSKLSNYPNLTILNANILELDPSELVKKCNYKVVANLPYYIAMPILRRFLEASFKPDLMVVMMQKEVAQSMVAGPGDMGILSISVQLYGMPRILGYVQARSFYPKPKVDSAIVRIDVYPKPAVDVKDIAGFFEVIKAGFSTPRKQIRNSLAIGLDMPSAEISDILKRAEIDPRRRPETLSLEDWARLHQIFTEHKRVKRRSAVTAPKN
jgi:16S rRNA (adenine1518-N6/adenine1519-N6)-dimethyltransferase